MKQDISGTPEVTAENSNNDSAMKEAAVQIKNIEKRRKRIQRMKRMLTFCLVVLLVFPNVSCILLLVHNYYLNTRIDAIYSMLSSESVVVSEHEETYLATGDEITGEELVIEDVTYPLPDSEHYPDKRRVYLTFDDGPSKYTDDILDILAEYDVKATFFVVAKEGYEEQYKRIVEEGHTLAIHSYSHKYSTIYETPAAFKEDVNQISDFLYEITGVRCEFYRFPGGSSNTLVKFDKQELFTILQQESLSYYDWNVTSNDAGSVTLSAETIKKNVLNGLEGKNDGIVLMHDAADKYTTVEALPLILNELTTDEDCVVLPITQGTKRVCHVVSE